MYLVKRTDHNPDYSYTRIFGTAAEALEDARQLAQRHVQEGADFMIYKLKPFAQITGSVVVEEKGLEE